MKMTKAVKLFALCASMVVGVGEAMAGYISTQKAVEPGVWTSDYDGALEYSEKNNIPMFVFWANAGCGHCEGIEKEMNKEQFTQWMAEKKLVMVFVESSSEVKKWIKKNAKDSLKYFPYAAIYWEKNTKGETVLEGFSAYKGNMSRFGADSKTSNIQQIIDTIEFLIPDWDAGDLPDDPEEPDDPAHTHVWSAWAVVTKADCTHDGLEKRTCSAEGCTVGTETRVVKALNHDWNDWVTDKEAEVGVAGEKHRTCKRCEAEETVEIPALDPVPDREVVDPAVLFKKAIKLEAIAYEDGGLYGRVNITLGKYSAKKKNVKATFKITSFAGKSFTKSVFVVPNEYGDIEAEVAFKSPVGTMNFELVNDDGEFEVVGEGDLLSVEAGEVVIGGKFENEEVELSVDFEDSPEPENDDYSFIVDEPSGVIASVSGGTKLNFGASPKIKYNKIKEDGDTWYELAEYDDEKTPNVNAVKVTYKPTTGAFSGSFKMYASNEDSIDEGKKPSLKTYTGKFSGVVVDGVGTGTVTIKIGKKTYTGTCSIE